MDTHLRCSNKSYARPRSTKVHETRERKKCRFFFINHVHVAEMRRELTDVTSHKNTISRWLRWLCWLWPLFSDFNIIRSLASSAVRHLRLSWLYVSFVACHCTAALFSGPSNLTARKSEKTGESNRTHERSIA